MSRHWDDDGQVDGDVGPPPNFVQYQGANAGQPWLRNPMPPWHMWGTSEIVTLRSQVVSVAPAIPTTQQLTKVNYRRPDTWQWLLGLRLVSGPDAPLVTDHPVITCRFDIMIGLGRSVISLPDFEFFSINWNGPAFTAPIGALVWSTEVTGPNRNLVFNDTPSNRPSAVAQLVAQDIQVSARLAFEHSPSGVPAQVEVTSFFAPRTHVRPDWLIDGPGEQMFAGAETEGR